MSKKKKTFRKRKEKIGDFILDINKYIVTIVLFSALFENTSEWGVLEYSLTVIVVMAFLLVAILLQEEEPNINAKNK